MKKLDPATLDPGICDVVVALRAGGYDTCDSGDGHRPREGTLPFPHVTVIEPVAGCDVTSTADEILSIVRRVDKREGWIVASTYSTADGVLMFVASLLHGAEVIGDDNADRLFAEGERDAARDSLAIARDHLEAANNAHAEAERDLVKVTSERDAAERRESELGLQVVAQAARLRLANAVVATLRQEGGSDSSADVRALAAWDAVPGDVAVKVEKPMPDCPRNHPCATVGLHPADECTVARWVGPDGEPER